MPDRLAFNAKVLPRLRTVRESDGLREKMMRNATIAKFVSENFVIRGKLKELNLKLNYLLENSSETQKTPGKKNKIIRKRKEFEEKRSNFDDDHEKFEENVEKFEENVEKFRDITVSGRFLESKLKELEYYQ
jgi:uncharacterized coiled-coil DUF342 family protein